MRGYGKAPKYVRNDEIDACETTDAIEKLFPEISFMDGYRKIKKYYDGYLPNLKFTGVVDRKEVNK